MKKRKRILAGLLVFCLLQILPAAAFAEPQNDSGEARTDLSAAADTAADDAMWKEGVAAVTENPDGSRTQHSTLQEAVSAASEGAVVEVVSSGAAVTGPLTVDKNITLTGGTLTRDDGYTGYLLRVSSGTLTLKDITLDGEDRGDVKNALIRVEKEAKLVIGRGASVQNNRNSACYVHQESLTKYTTDVDGNQEDGTDYAGGVYTWGGQVVLDGGAVSDNTGQVGGGIGAYGGKITVRSGEISRNMAHWYGGGICARYADVDVKGGRITENTAGEGEANRMSNPKPSGGGIYVAYADMTMSGGEVTKNKALNWLGGGIFISGALSPARFTMTGGSVNHNFAQVSGGGIYIECGTAAVMDGEIEVMGNEAKGISLYNGWYYFGGGGIYVNGGVSGYPDASLTIKNVIVTENTAAANGKYTGPDSSNLGYAYGYGGGVAACGTGGIRLYLTEGGAIYRNRSNSTASDGKYNDVQVYIQRGSGVDLRISKSMLGGGSYQWKNWAGTTDVDVDALTRTSTIFLNPQPEEEAIQGAESLGTIVVRENQTDSIGGGIAINGTMVVGAESAGSLSISKTVSGSGGNLTRAFDFTVSFTGGSLADSYPYILRDADGSIQRGALRLTDGAGGFSLKHGQTITVTGLPADTAFEVAEIGANGYTVTSRFEEQTTGSAVTGTIPEEATAAVSFDNYRKSSGKPDDPPKPDDPDDPVTPDLPDDPDDPVTPDLPDDPDDPNDPKMPDLPEAPEEPADPGEPKLPQTGQPWQCISLLAAAGVALVAVGLMGREDSGEKRMRK